MGHVKVKQGVEVQYSVAGVTLKLSWQEVGKPEILANNVYLTEAEAKKLAANLEEAADGAFRLRRQKRKKK